jgi:hypothetical protein
MPHNNQTYNFTLPDAATMTREGREFASAGALAVAPLPGKNCPLTRVRGYHWDPTVGTTVR